MFSLPKEFWAIIPYTHTHARAHQTISHFLIILGLLEEQAQVEISSINRINNGILYLICFFPGKYDLMLHAGNVGETFEYIHKTFCSL